MKSNSAKRVALCGILIAVALMFSYLESFIPINIAVPGVKLGLANTVTIFGIFLLKKSDTVAVALLRVLLGGLLFQNPVVIVYSLAGAALSILAMYIVKGIPKVGVIGVSVTGAVFHNLGQCIVAAILLENENIMYYMTVLLVTGLVAGIVVGLAAGVVVERLRGKVGEIVL